MITFLYFLLIAVLVALNAFFVAAEFAMVKVRGSRIDEIIASGNKRGQLAKNVVTNLDAYLSACQLGITLASLGLGWVGEPAVARVLSPLFVSLGLSEHMVHVLSFAVAFTIITSLHIVLGELAPKSVAIQKAEQVTLALSPPLVFFYKLMYPFIWLMNGSANWMLRLFGFHVVGDGESAHTGGELRMLMEESHKHGLINQTELTLVDNIFDFSELTARDVMIHRTDMICLYLKNSYQENLHIAVAGRKTRYPLCGSNTDEVVGFVHIKDLLCLIESSPKKPNLKSITREILFIPENLPVSSVLKDMQKKKVQIAMLIDEYGGTVGMVTLKDILEEIVGDIFDEIYSATELVEKRDDGSYYVDGRITLENFNEMFDLELEEEDIITLGGWIAYKTGLNFEVGQKIEWENCEFTIVEADLNRIRKILFRKKEETGAEEDDE